MSCTTDSTLLSLIIARNVTINRNHNMCNGKDFKDIRWGFQANNEGNKGNSDAYCPLNDRNCL